jgi:corrinoid protein of di/trimethylamine methyltransferase
LISLPINPVSGEGIVHTKGDVDVSTLDELYAAVLEGKRNQSVGLVQEALDEGIAPMTIVEQTLRPAMSEVGTRFSTGEFFLPDLILAAEAMKNATSRLRPLLGKDGEADKQETVVIGTVQGDVHDIGKNLVIATLEGTGYHVVDLGVDVTVEPFVEAVREHDPAVVGFSALLSTTMVNIPQTIHALEEASLRQGRLIAVGGAPITQRNADEWRADIYASDAGTAARVITEQLAAGQLPDVGAPVLVGSTRPKERKGVSIELEPYLGEPDVERFKAALRGQKVDRVPNFESLVDDEHVTKLLGRYAGNTLAIGGDPAKGAEEATGRPMHAKDYLEFAAMVGQDVIMLEAIWTPFKKRLPDGTLAPAMDRGVKTRQDWEALVMPDDSDIEDRLQYVREYKAATKGTRIGVVMLAGAIFQTLYEFVIGLTDAMMMCYEQRDLMEEMLNVSANHYGRLVEAAVAEGLDVFFLADDFAWKEGLFIPPQIFKELWIPRAQRIIAPALDAGIPTMFHSDGRVDDAMEWLIDMGFDGFNPMDPYGVDYRDYKKRYGDRITLIGNIDVEYPLVHGTPEEVEKDVIAHMEVLKPGGRYIAGSSHSVTNFVPHENYVAMLNAFHRYGVY